MSRIFTKIIQGEIPSYKVYEDDLCYAFLDIRPLREGHTLVIPKKEVDYIFDIDEELYTILLKTARKIALAIGKAIPCDRVGMTVVGLEVPHAHIHLIPISAISDMNFSNKPMELSSVEMANIAKKIAAEIL